MRVRKKHSWEKQNACSISEAVDKHLDVYYGEGGVVEDLRRQQDRTRVLISNLVQMLHEKGSLSDEQVLTLLPECEKVEK